MVLRMSFILVVWMVAVLGMSGCVSQEDVQTARDTTAAVVDETQALFDSVTEERDAALSRVETAIAARDEVRAKAERVFASQLTTRLGDIQVALTAGNDALEKFDEALANWQGPGGLLQGIGETLLPFIPAPAQGGAVTVLGVGGLLVRLVQKSRGLNSLAKSTVRMAEKNTVIAEAIRANADALRRTQTGAAKRAINAAQGSKMMLPM